jgi:uncharacterized protein (DUF2384 family)
MNVRSTPRVAPEPDAAAVLTKAVVRAADHLGVSAQVLAEIIGVSPASVSRMRQERFVLEAGSKPFELGVLFVRMFRSLDTIVGGDVAAARQWLSGHNVLLSARPIDALKSVSGLAHVVAYLDARRAPL